jgi:hypothetical protein
MTALVSVLGPICGLAQVQTYTYSGPLDGQSDIGLNPGSGYTGSAEAYFGSINETIYYTPSSDTVQEVGTITLSSVYNPSFNMINELSGNPFNSVVGSANVTVGNNNACFSFNITSENIGLPHTTELGVNLPIPVSGFGAYEGESFSGSWDVNILLNLNIISATSTAFTFSQYAGTDPGGYLVTQGQEVLAMPGLYSGLQDGTGGDDTYWSIYDQDAVTATAVDPSTNVPDSTPTLALLAFGCSAMVFLRRRQALRSQIAISALQGKSAP